ncbi:MAG: hypothetical protein H0U27_10510 [Nitrosopumilus sp.]|nr:hypothetical protein [Nitrosopumilus sp.]
MKSKLILQGVFRFTALFLIIFSGAMVPKLSAQPDTVDLSLKVSLFEEDKVHIIWHSINNYEVEQYFVEKSTDNINWELIDSTSTDNLVDIMNISQQTSIDPFGSVLHSTESGAIGFIKNEIILNTNLLPLLCYRIRGVLSNSSIIVTNYKMIYGIGLITQPPPVSPPVPGNCQISTIPPGYTLVSPVTTQSSTNSCCTEIETRYVKTIITGYTPGSCAIQTSQNNCYAFVQGSNCTYQNSYDPCCGHIGSCYLLCDCNAAPGYSTWTPCDPVYGLQYDWFVTSVIPFYPPLEITGMDVSCENGFEVYCTNGISGFIWSVPSGQGIIIGASNQNCVTVQWLNPGVHTISVTASVCSGVQETATLDVTVLSPGVPFFTVAPGNIVCEGTSVCFSPFTTGTQNTSYEWFINGQSVALEYCPGIGSCGGLCGQYQQTFTGSLSGIQYTIDLIIYDINGNPIGCTGTSQIITVYSNPISSFQLPASCIDINSQVNFCADQSPLAGIVYSWNISGGMPSSGNTQCITNVNWSAAGLYPITLTVSNPGCTSSTTNNILINDVEFCCDENNNWNYTIFNAPAANSTWSDNSNPLNNAVSPVLIKDELRIPQYANVIINNMEFQFGLSGKVVIEAGATLTINGTTFKGSPTCSTMWQGVIVEGIKNNPNLASQGQFYMNQLGGNNSKIENAEVAIINLLISNINTIGGYFQLNNAEINDCRNGVLCLNKNDFGTYQNIINNCSFTNPNALWYPNQSLRAQKHIYSENNTEAQLLLSGHNTIRDAEIGIFLMDATGYHISNCEFHDIGTGIWFIKNIATQSSNMTIDNNTFDIFRIGIRIDNGSNDNIGSNIFNTRFLANPADPLGSQFQNFSGIEMNASSGFSITDNTFHNLRNGIKVTDSGPIGGKINTLTGFGNQFFSCWRGIQTMRDNSNLDIKCNYHQNNQSSFNWSTAWYVSGQLKNQGTYNPFNPLSKDPAGNEFIRFPQSRVDLYAVNAAAGFTYTHHDMSTCSECRPTVNNTTFIQRQNTPIQKDGLSCSGFNFMESVNYNPTVAQQVISTETDVNTRRQYINELVSWYVDNNMESEATLYLESINELPTDEILILLYMRSESYTEVQNLINDRSNLTDEESINYVALNSILLNWAQNGQSPYDMTASQVTIIHGVAESQTRSAIQAQSIIAIVFDTLFVSAPADTVEERYGMVEQLNTNDNDFKLQIVPNPSDGQLYLSFNLPETDRAAEIVISDILGIEVIRKRFYFSQNQTPLDLMHLKTGSYLMYLKFLDSGNSVHKKLSIIK